MQTVNFGEVPLSKVFDLKGFNLNTTLEIDPDFLTVQGTTITTMTTATATRAMTTPKARPATTRTTTPTTTT